MIVEFVFFQFRIFVGVFLTLIRTFLEKMSLLCNLNSYLGVCRNELRQNRCYSIVILILSCGFTFPPMFPVFLRSFNGVYEFSSFVV